MTQTITTRATMTIGIDLGDRTSHLCVLDGSGDAIEESQITTTPKAFRARFEGLAPSRIALEVGTHSAWGDKGCGRPVESRARRFAGDHGGSRGFLTQPAPEDQSSGCLLGPLRHFRPPVRGSAGQTLSSEARARRVPISPLHQQNSNACCDTTAANEPSRAWDSGLSSGS